MAQHSFEDHTSEVRLCVTAETVAAVFEQAGHALAELMLDAPPGPSLGPAEDVHLVAPDRAALLVHWLNELIFLSETRKQVYVDFDVHSVSETALHARCAGSSRTSCALPSRRPRYTTWSFERAPRRMGRAATRRW